MIPIVDNILGQFSSDLAVDLGTVNTLIFARGKGVVVHEPSIVAQHKKTKKILAYGLEAKKMLGRTPASIVTVRPLENGVIADFDVTSAMLSYFVHKIHATPNRKLVLPRPKMVIGVPSEASEVEKRALSDVAMRSGAREAYLVEEPLAAALGIGLAVDEPVGSMIVDIGGGTCEIAVISLGGIVVGRSLKVAGDAMDGDIIKYVRIRYGLAIGERSAEEVKIALGNVYPTGIEKEMVIRGRDLEKGLPKSVKISSTQVREALAESINTIVAAIGNILHDTPWELVSDIAERGIVLSGGGAQILGIAKLISKETKMPVMVASEPLNCVVLGAATLLSDEGRIAKYAVGF